MNETNVEKGKKFEDEVAEIYRNFDGVITVIQNHLLRGIQIDIYVEMQIQGGIIIKLAIDTKNYEGNLPADEARKCVNDFNVLKSNNLIDKGVVVASKGFSQSANSAIIESGYEAKQMKDLQKNSLDFTKHLKKWLEEYEAEKNKIIKYISLSAKKSDGEYIKKLDAYLLKWLKNNTPHITILGNYGAGKSTTLRYIMATQAQKYIDNPEKERIPLFIELKGYRQAPKSRQLITDLLVNDFGLNTNYYKFNEMNEAGRFLIILDGFDEMAEKVMEGIPYQHFEELSQLAKPNSKVILTSRTHYFRDPDHVSEVHDQQSDLMSHVEKKNGYEITYINKFTENDINMYLKAAFGDKWDIYKETIKNTYDLSSLAEIPILLNMIVQVLPNMINENIGFNRAKIYEIFTDKWLQRETWRRSSTKGDRLKFSKNLAAHFYRNNINSVHWMELPEFIRQSYNTDHFNDKYIFESDVRTSNFLKREENSGQYSFVHKSFMEFFVAESLHDNIRNQLENGLDFLTDYMGSKVIYEFLLEMLTPDDIKLIKDDITHLKIKDEDIDFEKMMMNRYYSGKQNLYSNPESLGNCIYLLINSGIKNMDNIQAERAMLKGVEFNDISFCDANLTGINFENCILNNVKFNNTILTGASFRGAKLKDVDFTKATLEKIDFRNINPTISTLQTICKGKHWGISKFDSDIRDRVERLYKK